MKTAIIDLGTNTFHLMIAEGMQILHRERIAVKIGMGGINEGYITDEGLLRGIAAMKKFREKIDRENVRSVMAFGTSALRNAKNGQAVAARLEEESRIPVSVISGDEEAAYIYAGVRAAVPMGDEISLIIDIGGGSVEFILGDSQKIYWQQSFEIGAQRLLERFQKHDPILPEEITTLKKYLDVELTPLIAVLKEFAPKTIVGSSGTFDTLSEMYCLGENILYSETDPETPLTIESFYKTFSALKMKNRAERMKMPGMIEMRVDMIVVACCLIEYLLDAHAFLRIRVSTYSLKEGVMGSAFV